ncbi:MAG: DUF3237 family protein [Cellvibrionaceae bacterium]
MLKVIKQKYWVFFLILFSVNNALADEKIMDKNVKPLTTQLVMELKVTIGKTVVVGESDNGSRQYIPITGGEFFGADIAGEKISGEVLAGGADWQLKRPDGVLEVDALYSIKTSDGAVIVVHNQGIIVLPEAKDGKSGFPYIRTAPTFHAPKGKYDWLNKKVFVGTITPAADGSFVTIRVFVVN